ncbi:MAG: hypothetical protein AAF664_23460, partial [Planctomycetota bacterium]
MREASNASQDDVARLTGAREAVAESSRVIPATRAASDGNQPPVKRSWVGAAGWFLGGCLALGVAGWIIEITTDRGKVVVETDQPDVKINLKEVDGVPTPETKSNSKIDSPNSMTRREPDQPTNDLSTRAAIAKVNPELQIAPERLKAIYQNVTIGEHLSRLRYELDVDTLIKSLEAIEAVIRPEDKHLAEQMMLPARRLGGWKMSGNGTPSQKFMEKSQFIYRRLPRELRIQTAIHELKEGNANSQAVSFLHLLSNIQFDHSPSGKRLLEQEIFAALNVALRKYAKAKDRREESIQIDEFTVAQTEKAIHNLLYEFIAIRPHLTDQCRYLSIKLDINTPSKPHATYSKSISRVADIQDQIIQQPWHASKQVETRPLIETWPSPVNVGMLVAFDWLHSSGRPYPSGQHSILRLETHYSQNRFTKPRTVNIVETWDEMGRISRQMAADYWALAMLWSMSIAPELASDETVMGLFSSMPGEAVGDLFPKERLRTILHHHNMWINHLEDYRKTSRLPKVVDLAVAYLRRAIELDGLRIGLAGNETATSTQRSRVGLGRLRPHAIPQATAKDNRIAESAIIPALDEYLKAHPTTVPEYPDKRRVAKNDTRSFSWEESRFRKENPSPIDPERLKAIYQNVTIGEHLSRLHSEHDIETLITSLKAIATIIEPKDTYLAEQMMIPARRFGGWDVAGSGTPSEEFMEKSQEIYRRLPESLRIHAATHEFREGNYKSHAASLGQLISGSQLGYSRDNLTYEQTALVKSLNLALSNYPRGFAASPPVPVEAIISRNAYAIHERVFDFISYHSHLADVCDQLFLTLNNKEKHPGFSAYLENIDRIKTREDDLIEEPWTATKQADLQPLLESWPTSINSGQVVVYDRLRKRRKSQPDSPDLHPILRWETHYSTRNFLPRRKIRVVDSWAKLNDNERAIAADYWALAMLWVMSVSPEKIGDETVIGRHSQMLGDAVGSQFPKQRLVGLLHHYDDWIEHLEEYRKATHIPKVIDLAVAHIRQAIELDELRKPLAGWLQEMEMQQGMDMNQEIEMLQEMGMRGAILDLNKTKKPKSADDIIA